MTQAGKVSNGKWLAPWLRLALALGIWWGWRDRELRKPLGIALTVGILSWGFSNGSGGRLLVA